MRALFRKCWWAWFREPNFYIWVLLAPAVFVYGLGRAAKWESGPREVEVRGPAWVREALTERGYALKEGARRKVLVEEGEQWVVRLKGFPEWERWKVRSALLEAALRGRVQPAARVRLVEEKYREMRAQEHLVAGNLVTFVVLNLLTLLSGLVSEDRKTGALARVRATPLRGQEILAGYAMAGTSLGGLAILVLLGWSAVFRLLPEVRYVVFLLLLLAAFVVFCSGLAVFLGAHFREPETAAGLGVLLGLSLAALGGAWWPVEIAAPWMQRLVSVLPTGWVMGAAHTAFLTGLGGRAWEAAAFCVVALLVLGTAFLWIGGRRLGG